MTIKPIIWNHTHYIDGRIKNIALLPFNHTAMVRETVFDEPERKFLWNVKQGTVVIQQGEEYTENKAMEACEYVWKKIVGEALVDEKQREENLDYNLEKMF
jgi:hypothetical protein